MVACTLAAAAITALLVNIFERKQEARSPYFRVVELTDKTTDAAVWARSTAAARRCRTAPPRPIPG
jgi:nitrite reductase (cytochrome c-552)